MLTKKKNNNIYLATTSFGLHSDKPIQVLNQFTQNVKYNDAGKKLGSHDMINQLNGIDGVIAGTENYNKENLDNLNDLKVISRLGVGIDNIDIEHAKELGIKIYTTSTSPALAVAELVLGLIINLSRKISLSHSDLKSKKWNKRMGLLLSGKTLGIIGLGTIGKQLVKISSGFNFNILAFDINIDNEFKDQYNITYCELDELLAKSDIISLHLNLTEQTKGLINKEKLDLIQPNAIIVNASRGEIINEEFLLNALKDNKIGGVGLDVYNEEPYFGPLSKFDNVVLTPHIGSYAKELRIQMEIEAVNNLIKGLNEV